MLSLFAVWYYKLWVERLKRKFGHWFIVSTFILHSCYMIIYVTVYNILNMMN